MQHSSVVSHRDVHFNAAKDVVNRLTASGHGTKKVGPPNIHRISGIYAACVLDEDGTDSGKW